MKKVAKRTKVIIFSSNNIAVNPKLVFSRSCHPDERKDLFNAIS